MFCVAYYDIIIRENTVGQSFGVSDIWGEDC